MSRLTLAATFVLTVAVAAASYYIVERPILRLKYRRAQGPDRTRLNGPGTRRAPT